MFVDLLIIALVVTFTIMTVMWLVQLKTRNAGIVDVAWAGNLGLLAVIYAWVGEGNIERSTLLAAMVVLWSLRLTIYLFQRNVGQEEEGRYQHLRRTWQPHINFKFLLFFWAQGILDVILSLPFLLVCLNPAPSLAFPEFAGTILWLVAFSGEVVADRQLQRFKSNPKNSGKVCQVGLWQYSRHPNYFFEWLIWVSYFIFALGSPYGLAAVISPLLMLFFILKVTGIPPTEEQSLRSKGDAYRRYQKTTSPFVLWPRKSAVS